MSTVSCVRLPAQAQHSLQSQSAGAILLGCHPPHRAEPQPQRRMGVLKVCPGRHRRLIGTFGALPKHASQRPPAAMPTTRATETIRPSQTEKILSTGFLGRETSFEFSEIARIVLHRPAYYRLGLPESTGYPASEKSKTMKTRTLGWRRTFQPMLLRRLFQNDSGEKPWI